MVLTHFESNRRECRFFIVSHTRPLRFAGGGPFKLFVKMFYRTFGEMALFRWYTESGDRQVATGTSAPVRGRKIPTEIAAFIKVNYRVQIFPPKQKAPRLGGRVDESEVWMDPKADALTARLRYHEGVAVCSGFTHRSHSVHRNGVLSNNRCGISNYLCLHQIYQFHYRQPWLVRPASIASVTLRLL